MMDAKKQIKKSNTMKLVELTFKEPVETLLKRLYTEQRKPILEVASILAVSPRTVQNWLVMFDIPRRHLTFQ